MPNRTLISPGAAEYNIAGLVRGNRVKFRKGNKLQLKPIRENLSLTKQYETEINKIFRDFVSESKNILANYKNFRQHQFDSDLTIDNESWFRTIKELIAKSEGFARTVANKLFRLDIKRHTKTFRKDVKSKLGIDVSTIVREEDLDSLLRDAISENVSLIRGLGEYVNKQIEHIVYQAKKDGKSVADVQRKLQRTFWLSKKRAKLIARDQLQKFNSDMSRIRHEQAGIKEYVWRNSGDSNVRPLHKAINGRTYKYGQRTDAEDGLPPGKPIMCRCVAQSVVEF